MKRLNSILDEWSLAIAIFFFALAFWLSGCALSPFKPAKAPRAEVTAPGVAISQDGDTPEPAAVNTSSSKAALPVPAGSVVRLAAGTAEGEKVENKGLSVELSAPSVLTVETVSTVASGPRSFTPPAPPSPVEISKGRAAFWLTLGLRVGMVLGFGALGFGLVRDWDLVAIGGGCIALACLVGELIERVPPWLWGLLGIGCAAAVIGPSLWHLKLKKGESKP